MQDPNWHVREWEPRRTRHAGYEVVDLEQDDEGTGVDGYSLPLPDEREPRPAREAEPSTTACGS